MRQSEPAAAAPPDRGAAAMVLLAAVLWGVSGTVAQYLMQDARLTLAWLATARMAAAAVILLALAVARSGGGVWAPWRSPAEAARLVVFGLLGLFLVQYSYLAAIFAANAATATVLQYTGSGLVVLWAAAAARRPPPARQVAALAAALLGIALLATNGSVAHLALPLGGLAWGLVAAVTLAVYTILPRPLLQRHETLPVVGWGMAVAAVAAAAVLHPAPLPAALARPGALALAAFVLILGTALPFTLYLSSARRLPASESALLANSEPVAAAIVAMAWLHVRLGPWAIVGAGLVLAATTALFLDAGRVRGQALAARPAEGGAGAPAAAVRSGRDP